jgi:hypothetical protein
MIPDLRVDVELDYDEQPSRAWRLDFEQGRFSGTVDGLDAVAQAAMMAIQTQRYQYLIFSHQYGSELATLVGMDTDYIFSEGKRMIEDALSTDSHITDVRDFAFEKGVISFTIDTIYGTKTMDTGGITLEEL